MDVTHNDVFAILYGLALFVGFMVIIWFMIKYQN